MLINAIENYSNNKYYTKSLNNRNNVPKKNISQNNVRMITFKGGNPKHVVHIISEEPWFGFQNGGVGTVSSDYNLLNKDLDKIVKIVPLYNVEKNYEPKTNSDGELIGAELKGLQVRKIPNNLPDGHKLKKYENKYFLTNQKITKSMDLPNWLNSNSSNVFILDEISKTTMPWGAEKDVPIAMYHALKTDETVNMLRKKGLSDDEIKKLEFVFTYVDSTGSMDKPYAGFEYSFHAGNKNDSQLAEFFAGKPYPKESKAAILQFNALKEKLGIDPAYVLLSDGQPSFGVHYGAQLASQGSQIHKGITYGTVTHNTCGDYPQAISAKDAVVALATPEEMDKIKNSNEFIDALKKGEKATDEFFKSLLPKDLYGKNEKLFSLNIPIWYAERDYGRISTVSDFYADSLVSNPNVAPALHERLRNLYEKGSFRGIINTKSDPNFSAFVKDGLITGYKNDTKLKLENNQEVVVPAFKTFDKSRSYDLDYVRSIKRENMLNLIERFNPKYKNAKLFNPNGTTPETMWNKAGSGFNAIVAGLPNKNVKLHGSISSEYLSKVKSGNANVIVSWGRDDLQKGLDTVMDTFKKLVQRGDKDSILLVGGPMETEYGEKLIKQAENMLDKPEFKGRMMFFEGFAPNSVFAGVGDYALLPSRFAPCELTDLEAMRYLCVPVVPDVQGMAQKVIDPSQTDRTQFMNGYKGNHIEYYMGEEKALSVADEATKKKFTDAKDKLVKEIKQSYYDKLGNDTKVSQDLIDKELLTNSEYATKYQKLYDELLEEISSDDMANTLERAIKEKNSENAKKILKNHIDLKMSWEDNEWMSKDGKTTSGQAYRDFHFFNPKNGSDIAQKDILKLDLSGLTQVNNKENNITENIENNNTKFFKSIGGKIVIIAAVLATATGLILHFNKNKKKNDTLNIVSKSNDNYDTKQEKDDDDFDFEA